MTDNLDNLFFLFKKLSNKAKETETLIDYENAVSMIDLIKSRYFSSDSIIEQHQTIFVEFTDFLFWACLHIKDGRYLNKFSKYSNYLERYFPDNFEGCFFRLFLAPLQDRDIHSWDVNSLQRAYLKEISVTPIKLERYHFIYTRIYNTAQVFERRFPKVSKKVYEILTNYTYQGELDCLNLSAKERDELLAEIEEIHLISQAKVVSMKGFFLKVFFESAFPSSSYARV